jgi:antitoxin component YwqK of YwqJK toxin-antitoxin module
MLFMQKRILHIIICFTIMLQGCTETIQRYDIDEVEALINGEMDTYGIVQVQCDSIYHSPLYHLKSTKRPISGIVYAEDEKGQVLLELSLKEGKRDGIARKWYGNGELYMESSWKENAWLQESKEGLFTIWFENGQKELEEIYGINHYGDIILIAQKFWRKSGEERRIAWSQLTNVKNKEHFTAMVKDSLLNDELIPFTGTAFQVFDSGKLKMESTYIEGKAKLRTEWFENGQVKIRGSFWIGGWGYEYDIQYWDKNGQLIAYQEASDGGAFYKCWDGNGVEIECNSNTFLLPYLTKIYPDAITLKRDTSFLKRHHNTIWTNGIQTLNLKEEKLKDKSCYKTDECLVESIELDGVLYQKGCNKILECEMCGYAAIQKNNFDTLVLYDAYRDDFGGVEGSVNTLYMQENRLIQEKIYFYDFETSLFKFTWIPIKSNPAKLKEVRLKNESTLKEYKAEKDSVIILYMKTVDF